MRHRRHHRRRNPSNEDLITLGLGALGGAAAMFLWIRSIQQAQAASQNSLTVTGPSGSSG